MSETLTPTRHRAAALTAASALAMYDAAGCAADRARAAAAMAEVLRAKPPKPKPVKAASDVLTAETLTATLRRICAIVERRNTIPIMSCVRLKSMDNHLTLAATDLDMTYAETVRASGTPDFAMAIPAHDLLAAVRGARGPVIFSDRTIQPRRDETERVYDHGDHGYKNQPKRPQLFLGVTIGDMTVKLPGLPVDDFPVMKPPKAKPRSATLPASAIFEPLAFVQSAISTEETRYYLNGAYMHVTEDGAKRSLTFVATDGHRMLKDSRVRADFPLSTPAVIIPRKAVAWMLRHVHDAEMRLDVWDGWLRLTTATGTFQTKTVGGSFPDYNRIIPADRAKTVLGVSDPKAFGDAITRLTSQSKERGRSIALTCQNGVVRASSRTLKGAAVEAVLPAKLVGWERGLPSFNGVYLREMVGKDQAVTIDLNGENDPALFLWPGAPGRCGVLMPLRV